MWGGRSGGLQNKKERLAWHWLTHTLVFITWRAKVEESIKLKEDSIRLPTIQLNTLIQHVVVVKEKLFITISFIILSISRQKRVLHEQTDRQIGSPSATHSSGVRQSNSVLSNTSRGRKLGNVGVGWPFPEKSSSALAVWSATGIRSCVLTFSSWRRASMVPACLAYWRLHRSISTFLGVFPLSTLYGICTLGSQARLENSCNV